MPFLSIIITIETSLCHSKIQYKLQLDQFLNNKRKEQIKSPDLNPIENVWVTLKREVIYDAPQTREELIHSLDSNWLEITTPDKLENYISGLKSRYQTCIDNDGDMIDY